MVITWFAPLKTWLVLKNESISISRQLLYVNPGCTYGTHYSSSIVAEASYIRRICHKAMRNQYMARMLVQIGVLIFRKPVHENLQHPQQQQQQQQQQK
jgi:hypothetical protein